MKRFDLRQIMRDAHRTYKYVGKKQGKTFGEVLKSTWKLAKLNVTMQEELARQQEERNNKVFTPVKAEKEVGIYYPTSQYRGFRPAGYGECW